MATSVTELVNTSLIRIGQEPIADITEANKRATRANVMFATVRDWVLTDHVWNESLKRQQLAALETNPAWGFDKQHQVPDDFLRLIGVEDNVDYSIEQSPESGRVIASNTSPLRIVYVARLTSVMSMSLSLQMAISYLLSAELAQALTGSNETVQQMQRLYRDVVDQARFQDAIQSHSRDRIAPSSWLAARRAGSAGSWLSRNIDADAQDL